VTSSSGKCRKRRIFRLIFDERALRYISAQFPLIPGTRWSLVRMLDSGCGAGE